MSQTYTVTEGTKDDFAVLTYLVSKAYHNDEVWKVIFRDVSPEDEHTWLMAFIGMRYSIDDITLYVVKSDDGEILGVSALQWPWTIKPISKELKETCNSTDPEHIPPPPKGFKMDAWKEMSHINTGTGEHGYDPKQDFHRRGTVILPVAQKQGIGSLLTHHCNQIADEAGRRTWVATRPSSVKMFRSLGFKDVGIVHAHMERWGGSEELSKSWFLVREPQNRGTQWRMKSRGGLGRMAKL